MKMMVVNIVAALLDRLFRLRYRLVIRGLSGLRGRRGCLIMPNHPAEIDPVIVSSQLWKLFKIRPVVVDKFYFLPIAHFILSTIRAIPMPELNYGSSLDNRRKVKQAVQSIQDCIAALQRGENLLLYPAGRLMRSNLEQIGEKCSVPLLLKSAPNADVVLVRTRGLYGSSFSRALTGKQSPNFWATVKMAAAVIVKNFVFFAPRRTVTIEFVPAPPDFPRYADSAVLGRWLNEWYNRPGPDGPTLVSYSCWSNKLPKRGPLTDLAPDIDSHPSQAAEG